MCRLIVGAVGLMILAAGLLKATDMGLFIRQIKAYGLISHPVLLTTGAWGMIVLECGLGAGLLLFHRPGVTLPAAGILLVFFLVLSGWAWLTGVTEDCGCYGVWIKRTPGESFIEDMILLAALSPAWVWQRGVKIPQTRAKTWAVTLASLAGLVLPVAFGIPIPGMVEAPSGAGQQYLGRLEINGLDKIDLNRGDYLVLLMDTGCEHCQEAVFDINLLAERKDIPGLIALCTNDEENRVRFINEFQPGFPIGQISKDAFWRLLGEGDIPRIILLRNGRIQKAWDATVPRADSVKEAM